MYKALLIACIFFMNLSSVNATEYDSLSDMQKAYFTALESCEEGEFIPNPDAKKMGLATGFRYEILGTKAGRCQVVDVSGNYRRICIFPEDVRIKYAKEGMKVLSKSKKKHFSYSRYMNYVLDNPEYCE